MVSDKFLPQSELPNYTLIEKLDIFNLCLVTEMSVVPTSNNAVVRTIVNIPRTAPDTPILLM
jgi:hypothetical protein